MNISTLLNRYQKLIDRYYRSHEIDVDVANAIASALEKLIIVADEQKEMIERYEKALREIATEREVGEGDFNASDIANNLIATAKEALGW
ncbi:hypothetical protein ABEO46_06280 [Geobacillus stearothermophilus]|uniref:hypothetical protein n=1 Tax=Geobacillus TaxID=129337 RepID=UPI0009BEE0C2|nr:hypothetical protein [Geobacillus thermoleovorans]OQP13168.1 hypothetical protein B1692_08930 [Geobacillus thermoleovorans]QNU22318.1 hypothetical protein IC805_05085 [Geobacillus thermoleovorans]